MVIWQSVNPQLSLVTTMSIEKKTIDLLQLVKDIYQKHNKAAALRNLANKLTFFLILLGALLLWKCYLVMTEELAVMLITANKSTYFALAP